MEHKRGIDELLESLGEGDDSFDKFLEKKAKVKQVCADQPISSMKPTDRKAEDKVETRRGTFVEKRTLETIARANVPGVVVPSIPDTSRIAIPETSDPESSTPVTVAAAHETRLEVKDVPILGKYLAEEKVEWELDEEARAVFTEGVDYVISNALEDASKACNLAIQQWHKLERAIYLASRKQQGLRVGINAALHKLNAAQKAEYDKLDEEERKKYITRLKQKKAKQDAEKAQGKTKSAPKGTPKGSEMEKRVKSLKMLGYDRAGVTETVKNMGKLDESAVAIINKVFA